MCTVSFLPKSRGFYLAMNRDEKRDRFAALAPVVVKSGSRRAVFPREPTGGTWISANDAGVCLALINWHRIAEPASGGQLLRKKRNRPDAIETRNSGATQPVETTGCPSGAKRVEREPENDLRSRGLVVRELAGKSTADEIAAALRKLPLRKLRPFRLIAIVPAKTRVTEWRWNLERLTRRDHKWQRQHWFSSGFDERTAERVRAKVCSSFVAGGGLSAVALAKADDPGSHETSRRGGRAGVDDAGYSLRWLRELHRSHTPKRGPFSVCMHRADASTVSYTEVAVSDHRATMRYKPGPACAAIRTTATMLPVTLAATGKLRL
jgi:hypothetical protein